MEVSLFIYNKCSIVENVKHVGSILYYTYTAGVLSVLKLNVIIFINCLLMDFQPSTYKFSYRVFNYGTCLSSFKTSYLASLSSFKTYSLVSLSSLF
jgi:hypothetical protein